MLLHNLSFAYHQSRLSIQHPRQQEAAVAKTANKYSAEQVTVDHKRITCEARLLKYVF